MEPITIVIGICILIFGGGITIGLNWDYIKRRLGGKNVAVLGATAVGKTTLIRFLTSGEIPEEYQETGSRATYEGRTLQLNELKLVMNKGFDVPGRAASREMWQPVVNEAHIVLYLFRVDQVLKGDKATIKRVEDDITHITHWLSKRKEQPTLVLIGTSADKLPDGGPKDLNSVREITDQYLNNEAIRNLRHSLGTHSSNGLPSVVIGSLETHSDVERCAVALLGALTQ